MTEVNLSISQTEGWPKGNYKVEITGSSFEFAANEPARWELKGEDWISDDHISWPQGGVHCLLPGNSLSR